MQNTFIMKRIHADELEQRTITPYMKHVPLTERDYVYQTTYKEAQPCGNMYVLLATDIEGMDKSLRLGGYHLGFN